MCLIIQHSRLEYHRILRSMINRDLLPWQLCTTCVCAGLVLILLLVPDDITINNYIFAVIFGGCTICCILSIMCEYERNRTVSIRDAVPDESPGLDPDFDSHSIFVSSEDDANNEDDEKSKSYEIMEDTLEPGKNIDNTCRICDENAWQAALNCGHLLCSACIKKILSNSPEKQLCPFDRKPIQKELIVTVYA
jgi:Zinc finger, C3HC4 type (RING finger)